MSKTIDYRVAVIGLQNSGKSTIIHYLLKNEILESQQPTQGVKIEKLQRGDSNIYLWDYGGQKHYRKKYINNYQDYFSEIHFLYYVIDVQEEDWSESLEYLDDVMEIMANLSPEAEISVLFHKYDPDLENKERLDEKIKSFISDDLNYIFENINKEFSIYRTSIKEPETITNAFKALSLI